MKIGLFAASILAVASIPAFASAKTVSTNHKPAPDASTVESSGEKLHLSTGALQSVQDLLAHFQEIDAQLKSLSAKFAQSIQIADAGVQRQVDGTLEYGKTGRLHLEYLHPERQTVVSDGNAVWVYRPDFNQVIESKLNELKKTDPMVDHLLDMGNYESLLKRYDVSFDSAALTVTMRPKDAAEDRSFSLRMKLTGTERFPSETEITVGQMHVRMSFTGLRFNLKLDTKRFQFVTPQGADVYRDFKVPVLGGGSQ